jgi:hypothetical protein
MIFHAAFDDRTTQQTADYRGIGPTCRAYPDAGTKGAGLVLTYRIMLLIHDDLLPEIKFDHSFAFLLQQRYRHVLCQKPTTKSADVFRVEIFCGNWMAGIACHGHWIAIYSESP